MEYPSFFILLNNEVYCELIVMASNLTDEALMRNYRADGDNQWLGHLLLRYTALLFGVAMKYLKNKAHSEDAVQQVFEKVLTGFILEDAVERCFRVKSAMLGNSYKSVFCKSFILHTLFHLVNPVSVDKV